MKRFVVSMTYVKYGNSSIEVPDDFTWEQAVEYAKQHKDDIPVPKNGIFVFDSDELVNEEEWDFEE